jgi:hypothetical protein
MENTLKPMNRWEDNIKMDLKEIRVEWINLACAISQAAEDLLAFQVYVCSVQPVSLI